MERNFSEYPSLSGTNIEPCIPAPSLYGYRNHARYTIRREGSPGFVNRITRRFVQTDECMLMTPGINRLADSLEGSGTGDEPAIHPVRRQYRRLAYPANAEER